MGKGAERLEQGHHPRVAEAERGDALASLVRGLLEAVEGMLGQDAVMTEALDFEQLSIHGVAEIAQVGQVVDIAVPERRLCESRFAMRADDSEPPQLTTRRG